MNVKKILIVDDNADHADGLAMVLEDEGYSVKTVYNGTDAISSLRNERFNLVLLDAKLPDTNGLRIYHLAITENLADKVIIMTGFRLEQLIAETIPGTDLQIIRKIKSSGDLENILSELKEQSLVILADPSPEHEKIIAGISGNGGGMLHLLESREDLDSVSGKEKGIVFIKTGNTALERLGVYYELRIRNVLLPAVIDLGGGRNGESSADILRSFAETGCLFKPFTLEQMIEVVNKQIQEV